MKIRRLDKGWGFPPTFDLPQRKVQMVSEDEDIKQSLTILFSTKPGERLVNPDYGCFLYKLSFRRIDDDLINEASSIVREAIQKFEKRIEIVQLNITPMELSYGTSLVIKLYYRVKGEDHVEEFVYEENLGH